MRGQHIKISATSGRRKHSSWKCAWFSHEAFQALTLGGIPPDGVCLGGTVQIVGAQAMERDVNGCQLYAERACQLSPGK